MEQTLRRRISTNPDVMAGKAVIAGTRIPVDLIVKLVGQGMTREAILEDYPALSDADIQAALLYAAEVVANEEVFPLSTGKT